MDDCTLRLPPCAKPGYAQPQPETMVSWLEAYKPPPRLSNGSTTPFVADQGHSGKNGLNGVTGKSLQSGLGTPKTNAQTAVQYAGDLINTRARYLTGKQEELDKRVSKLHKCIRHQQLRLMHAYTSTQLKFVEKAEKEKQMKCSSTVPCSTNLDSHTTDKSLALPIQVDGASDDSFLAQVSSIADTTEPFKMDSTVANSFPARTRCEDSFSSLESCMTTSGSSSVGNEVEGTLTRKNLVCVKDHLASLETLVDPDLTDASSDEEEVDETADETQQQQHIG